MKRSRLILIALSVLILLGCIGLTAFLLFSNYQNVRLFKQAQYHFQQQDEQSLSLAESQLLQLIRSDSENEGAFIMLGEIARKRKVYAEEVYYRFMAYRLNPLSSENRERYIESLSFARYFIRLENLLAQESALSNSRKELLYYAACRNGNTQKYKNLFSRKNCGGIGALALLFYGEDSRPLEEKLAELDRIQYGKDHFLLQEILTVRTDLYLAAGNIEEAEHSLLEAYKLNAYAFAPALGRFYSRCRNLGKALEIFEKHLSTYHDQSVAVQTAELYCLLGKADKILALQKDYQADSGSRAMLCSYYFEALAALVKKNFTKLKELSLPLRGNINTPLSAFMFFCADIQGNDLAAVRESYMTLLAHESYLNLQEQADTILSDYLKKAFAGKNADPEKLLALAKTLYSRKPDAFTAKLLLLSQKRSGTANAVLLKDALKRFQNDPGIVKLAIEYYLKNDPSAAMELMEDYKKRFAGKARDMLIYEIHLNMRKKDYAKVSELFRKYGSQEILPEYWIFASTIQREEDLLFLGKDPLYAPFCKALLLLKQKNIQAACDLLEKADCKNDPALSFFAGRILGENGRTNAALRKYELIPRNSPYGITVLLNMAELYAESGDLERALILSGRAFDLAPQMPETQLCYADKLHRKGNLSVIPDIIRLSSSGTFRRRLEPLWISGMECRIKECNFQTQREKVRELCRQLLFVSPGNSIALESLKKLQKMPQ